MAEVAFDPEAIISVLEKHVVEYVLIGGLAGRLYGSPIVTRDMDVCYSRAPDNLKRLAAALAELHAAMRGVEPALGPRFTIDEAALRLGDSFTFSTTAGDFDCLGTPRGVGGYSELAAGAAVVQIGSHTVRVASLDDLIAMKRAAGRPQDLLAVEHLAALREEREQANRPDLDK